MRPVLHGLVLLLLATGHAAAADEEVVRTLPGHTRFDLSRPEISAFVEHLASSGFQREAAYALLAKAEPQPKIIEAKIGRAHV